MQAEAKDGKKGRITIILKLQLKFFVKLIIDIGNSAILNMLPLLLQKSLHCFDRVSLQNCIHYLAFDQQLKIKQSAHLVTHLITGLNNRTHVLVRTQVLALGGIEVYVSHRVHLYLEFYGSLL